MRSNTRRSSAVACAVAAATGLLPVLSPLSFAATDARGARIDTLTEIVVTGSRIARPELNAPSPTTVVDAAAIEAGGITNIVELLNELPQISNGRIYSTAPPTSAGCARASAATTRTTTFS